MLKTPKVGGAAQLRLFVEEIGFYRSCQAIKVHEGTMRRWLRDATEPPQAALQALYWLTSWGFSDAFAEAHWSHQFLLGRLRQAEAAANWRAPARWQADNEAAYHAPGLVVPMMA
jgi:hypothetical protein